MHIHFYRWQLQALLKSRDILGNYLLSGIKINILLVHLKHSLDMNGESDTIKVREGVYTSLYIVRTGILYAFVYIYWVQKPRVYVYVDTFNDIEIFVRFYCVWDYGRTENYVGLASIKFSHCYFKGCFGRKSWDHYLRAFSVAQEDFSIVFSVPLNLK